MKTAGTLFAIACVVLAVFLVHAGRGSRIRPAQGADATASGRPEAGTRPGRAGDRQPKDGTPGIGNEARTILHLLEQDFAGTIRSMSDEQGQVDRNAFGEALAEYFRWQNNPLERMRNLDASQRQWVLDEYRRFVLPRASEIKDLHVLAAFAGEFMSDQEVGELLANLPRRVLDGLGRKENPFDEVADLFGRRKRGALAAVAEHFAEQRPSQIVELAQSGMIPLSPQVRTRIATGFGFGDFAAGTAWLATLPADGESRELAERMSRKAMEYDSLGASEIIASHPTEGPVRDGLIEGLVNHLRTVRDLDGIEGWINEVSDEQLAAKLRRSLESSIRIRDALQK